MSIFSVHSRQRIGNGGPRNILLSFLLNIHTHTHTHHFALEPKYAHIHAHDKVITCVILQRSIPSSETTLNDDKLSENATRQLTPRILET